MPVFVWNVTSAVVAELLGFGKVGLSFFELAEGLIGFAAQTIFRRQIRLQFESLLEVGDCLLRFAELFINHTAFKVIFSVFRIKFKGFIKFLEGKRIISLSSINFAVIAIRVVVIRGEFRCLVEGGKSRVVFAFEQFHKAKSGLSSNALSKSLIAGSYCFTQTKVRKRSQTVCIGKIRLELDSFIAEISASFKIPGISKFQSLFKFLIRQKITVGLFHLLANAIFLCLRCGKLVLFL